jgi:hypothetical protein
MSGPPDTHVRQIARWCAGRVPVQVRHQVRVESKVRGRNVTIVERRPPWQPDGPDGAEEWLTMPVAQLRFSDSGHWQLYAADSQRRWRRYPGARDAPNPGPLLEEIEADPIAIFWG